MSEKEELTEEKEEMIENADEVIEIKKQNETYDRLKRVAAEFDN